MAYIHGKSRHPFAHYLCIVGFISPFYHLKVIVAAQAERHGEGDNLEVVVGRGSDAGRRQGDNRLADCADTDWKIWRPIN